MAMPADHIPHLDGDLPTIPVSEDRRFHSDLGISISGLPTDHTDPRLSSLALLPAHSRAPQSPTTARLRAWHIDQPRAPRIPPMDPFPTLLTSCLWHFKSSFSIQIAVYKGIQTLGLCPFPPRILKRLPPRNVAFCPFRQCLDASNPRQQQPDTPGTHHFSHKPNSTDPASGQFQPPAHHARILPVRPAPESAASFLLQKQAAPYRIPSFNPLFLAPSERRSI